MVEIDERLGELIAKIPMLVDELGGLRATAHTLAEHGRKAGEESGKRPRARAVKRKAVAVELILKAAQNPKLSHGSIANAVIGKTGGKEFSRP
jgi:hypothetical protein